MVRKAAALIAAFIVWAVVVPGAQAQVVDRSPVVWDVAPNDVLTTGRAIHLQLRSEYAEARTLEPRFEFADGRVVRFSPVDIGTIAGNGPDCGGRAGGSCDVAGFTLPLDALSRSAEGRGAMIVRIQGARVDLDDIVLYWDPTPPRARFMSPRFNDPGINGAAWVIVAQSPDENIIKLVTKWKPAKAPGRGIPRFEQHNLGNSLGPYDGHGSCVPTAVAANLRWLQDTAQGHTVPAWLNDPHDLVTYLGNKMETGTVNCCTSGAGEVDGTINYLGSIGLEQDVDYTFEHLNGAVTPEQLMEEFQQGGGISMGLHNPGFGHFVALNDVKLKPNGDAAVSIMDPNVEPNPGGATLGAYRSMTLHADGTMDWLKSETGYYDAPGNKVHLDELHILRDFVFFDDLGPEAAADDPGGEIPGVLLPDQQTWIGVFIPPAGVTGPFLLETETTDSAGVTQRDLQYVGGVPE